MAAAVSSPAEDWPETNEDSEEEEPEDHYFPLTLRTKKGSERAPSPMDRVSMNGSR